MNIRFNKQVAAIMKDARQEAKDMGNNYIGSEPVSYTHLVSYLPLYKI